MPTTRATAVAPAATSSSFGNQGPFPALRARRPIHCPRGRCSVVDEPGAGVRGPQSTELPQELLPLEPFPAVDPMGDWVRVSLALAPVHSLPRIGRIIVVQS